MGGKINCELPVKFGFLCSTTQKSSVYPNGGFLCLILQKEKYHFKLILINNALTIVRPSRQGKIGENTVD